MNINEEYLDYDDLYEVDALDYLLNSDIDTNDSTLELDSGQPVNNSLDDLDFETENELLPLLPTIEELTDTQESEDSTILEEPTQPNELVDNFLIDPTQEIDETFTNDLEELSIYDTDNTLLNTDDQEEFFNNIEYIDDIEVNSDSNDYNLETTVEDNFEPIEQEIFDEIPEVTIDNDENQNYEIDQDILGIGQENYLEGYTEESVDNAQITNNTENKVDIHKKVENCVVNLKELDNKSCFRKYNINTDTIGYILRGDKHALPAAQRIHRFRLLFTSADGTQYIPANTQGYVNEISARQVNQALINPFGEILYYSSTEMIDVGKIPPTNALWTQCAVTLGYSFNTTGKELKLTKWKPLYIKCVPQEDGSARIDSETPYVQSLPSFADKNIYIFRYNLQFYIDRIRQ